MSESPRNTDPHTHLFGSSSPFSLGVEEEFQIIDARSGALSNSIDLILKNVPQVLKERIKYELLQSVLEINTKVCQNLGEVGKELLSLRRIVAECAAPHGLLISGSATHPFSEYWEQQVTRQDRYENLERDLKWLVRREVVFGMHVHIGMQSPREAIYVLNGLRCFLPELLALSANSPLWQGHVTGLASSRAKVFETLPRGGIPPHFESWEDFCRLVDRLTEATIIPDYTFLWWDIRPHPNLGTIEIRVFDVQTSLSNTVALAGLSQALAATLSAECSEGVPQKRPLDIILSESKWRAARYGLCGDLIDLSTDRPIPAKKAVEQLLERVTPYAKEIGTLKALAGIEEILDKGNGAQQQLAFLKEGGQVRDLALHLASETVKDEEISWMN